MSNEGTVLGPFAEDPGGFQVNWTFVFNNYKADEAVFKDVGWTRYPQTVEGQESRPPIGGINVGVGAFSTHEDMALEAVQCITSEEESGHLRRRDRQHARAAGRLRGPGIEEAVSCRICSSCSRPASKGQALDPRRRTGAPL
ncbi:MAG: hypothetical protein WKF73_20920 [Nocardioidaceae bacterium]